jgi:hypothetical protein
MNFDKIGILKEKDGGRMLKMNNERESSLQTTQPACKRQRREETTSA